MRLDFVSRRIPFALLALRSALRTLRGSHGQSLIVLS
jgi:hypothetical protein